MSWLTNELLFYSGITIVALSLIMAFLSAVVLHIRRIHITRQLDEEYGKENYER